MRERFIQSVTHLAEANPKPALYKEWLSHTYDTIIKTYNGDKRFYHTMIHIEYMLTNLDKYFSNLLDETQRAKVELAIWFHDIIYDVTYTSGVNELLSGKKFEEFAIDALILEDVVNEISGMIMYTTHTKVPETLEQKITCDLDLLGLNGIEYWTNREKVLAEFTQEYTDEEFLEGRLNFLDWMLKKETIFHTGFFQKHFEESAINNLILEKSYFSA